MCNKCLQHLYNTVIPVNDQRMLIARERELEALGAVAALRCVSNEHGARIREAPAPLVVVYGGASTGKSACVAQALRQSAELSVLVDCTAVYSAPELYREVLAQLHNGARMSGGSSHSTGGGGEAAADAAELTIDGAPEQQQQQEESDGASDHGDDDSEGDADGGGDDGDVLSATTRTKRVRALQRRRRQQRDADATRGHRVRFEGDGALNFLGFVKALDNFVATTMAAAGGAESSGGQQRKRVVYLALDQADKLLDRGLAPLLTCIFTINEQLAYLNVSGAAARFFFSLVEAAGCCC